MSLTTKVGTRLRSTVCQTEVVVVRAPKEPLELRCGGAAMVTGDPPERGGVPAAGYDGGTLLGKRYVDGSGSVELLCSKPGVGSLSLGDELLETRGAKPLPASD